MCCEFIPPSLENRARRLVFTVRYKRQARLEKEIEHPDRVYKQKNSNPKPKPDLNFGLEWDAVRCRLGCNSGMEGWENNDKQEEEVSLLVGRAVTDTRYGSTKDTWKKWTQ
jgi:hypothetical protein